MQFEERFEVFVVVGKIQVKVWLWCMYCCGRIPTFQRAMLLTS